MAKKNSTTFKATRNEMAAAWELFSAMINAGVPVLECLGACASSSKNRSIQAVLLLLSDGIRSGKGLGQVLEEHSPFFTPVGVSLLRQGQEAGTIDQCTHRLSVHLYRKPSFWSGMSVQFSSGVKVLPSLEACAAEATGPGLKKALADVLAQVKKGSDLAGAFGRHPAFFKLPALALIKAGEKNAILDRVLEQLALLQERGLLGG